MRQHVDLRGVRTAIVDRDSHENVILIGFGVLHLDIEVAVFIENSRVDQLELHRRGAATASILFYQPLVRIRGLRQLVEHARVGVAGHGIE